MKKKLSNYLAYHDSFTHKPQRERLEEVEQSRKEQKRANKKRINNARFKRN